MPHPHPHRPPAATTRGLAALLLLCTAIIGVPVALLALGATPLPHHLPAPVELWQRLTRQDDGTLLIGFLTLTTWAAWATFTTLSALEIAAAARGRATPRLPGLRLLQEPITVLVAATMLLFIPLAWPAHAAPAPLTTGLPVQPDSATAASAHSNPARPAPPAPGHPSATAPPHAEQLPVYTVRPRDTLWRIAERHLGDGLRYHDILTLNAGR